MASSLARALLHDRTSRYAVNAANAITSPAAAHPIIETSRSAPGYSGTCDMTRMRGSVISSMAYFSPSRPNPESFDPP
jgi:hypothetical protein